MSITLLLVALLLLGSSAQNASSQLDPGGQFDNPAVIPLLTQFVYSRLSNLTVVISQQLGNRSNFCIKDPQADWNKAFNFSANLDFLGTCLQKTRGDMTRRICTAAEVKFFFNSYFGQSGGLNYIAPNKNCNQTSWVSGCEPGWACSTGADEEVDLQNSKHVPSRTTDCQGCCEGFFCPQACPLGSYCPLATFDRKSGTCEPYKYQIPHGQRNHTCGGANIWADVGSSRELFCSAGSYCPTTTTKKTCSSGNYCRMGSTSEKPCFKLTACDPNTSTQNIHAYGALLLAALSTVLLIFYNCSDQVLTTRERRLAKSRERAARNAKESARARERWKSAKRRAIELQNHLSRTFSLRKNVKHPEKVNILEPERPLSTDDQYLHDNISNVSEITENEPIALTNIMHAFEDGQIDGGHKHNTKHIHRGRDKHTRSQIFEYAYAQLEKEKVFQEENKDLTFSGVVKLATTHKMKKRPLIEVAFKDLTLTLKGKKKHLLRSVTGIIKPGRITAVMGPSGAGKTTFLSALGGKTIGCTVTGSILVNGKNETIRSFKKIIGYVPQDDIVHGNLTVEENLWFSANCRLSANMPKADKVLIVERVVESLGLQAVRDSLVGTVEKRGISGGQRKRVNVGLEMVIEPSLLILDEPTSGLDSSTSQLLLRALRREALEGVNVCMVVHQPSYALFRMFDDLVLLAKGGLTAYHGSARKAEEYFAGLGIMVPDRVNPPDHFIDVLEGIVKPSENSGVSFSELPVRWMLHNGYRVPQDMQNNDGPAITSASVDPSIEIGHGGENLEHSFAGELWEEVKHNVEVRRDKIRHNYLKSKDLSNRRAPGVLKQFKYFLGRVGKQRLREARIQAVDYLILLLAGACLGSLTTVSDQNFGAAGYTYTIIAVSLLCKIAALRSFSLDKLQYWRESASGMSSLAYFLAKDTIDHFNTLVKPAVYLSMFYFFSNPRSSFAENYIVLVCLVYCVTGIAYALAIFFQPGAAQLWSVLLPVVLTLLATRTGNGPIITIISRLCYTKWALEAFVVANAERYYGVWLITRCGALLKSGYDLHDWEKCLGFLILAGVGSRIIAFLCMVTFQKK
uniref:ABC transporter domain-containing protein n=1 Tax=Kalanchoe fedtschenkoi TaxID=63787 RepID=A0A7N0TLJ4_KALFE